MSKRTKKYNPHKNASACVERALRQSSLGVMYISGDKYCGMVNLITMERFNPTQKLCDMLLTTRLNWTVVNCVFLKESNGKTKLIMEEIASPLRCYQHQLSNSLQELHLDLLEEWEAKAGKNITGLGWLATPYSADLDSQYEHINNLFNKYGAYHD